MKAITSTKQFIEKLKKENELTIIPDQVNPHLDLPEIQRQAVKLNSKALLFTNVKNTKFSVATNLYGSQKRIELAFNKKPAKLIQELVNFAQQNMPPNPKSMWQNKNLLWHLLKTGKKSSYKAPVKECCINNQGLLALPQIKAWPEDGGAFITLPIVHTQSPTNQKENLGMYRIQIFNSDTCGVHMQIHRGGGFHYHEAEKLNQSLNANIYIGGPPALTLAAISPLPENIPETLFASLLMGQKLKELKNKNLSPLPILSQADFCITGHLPPFKRMPEGPFGDHYGYYSLKHDYPFLKVKNIFHRKDAIYPATVVGKPPQEDHFITCFLQDMLAPVISLVMPQVKKVWAYEESGVHTLATAIVKDRYPKEALTTALRILGEGQLSLTKFLLITNKEHNIKNIKDALTTVLERADFNTDFFILPHTSQDTLDYTSGAVNQGSKAMLLGLGDKKRELPTQIDATIQSSIKDACVFCPGVLGITAPGYEKDKDFALNLSLSLDLNKWPLVFVFDNAKTATASNEAFLWHTFTRFNPATDIYTKEKTQPFHTNVNLPIMIDCRFKPWYPKVLEINTQTVQTVSDIINKYLA